jgi:endonuclease/exonuclease/phosphatase family metal-dependent hydrolase
MSAASHEELTLVTCNTHWLFSDRGWTAVADLARHSGVPDVICLQEHWVRSGEAVPAHLHVDDVRYHVHHLPLTVHARLAGFAIDERKPDGSWGLLTLTRDAPVAVRSIQIGHAWGDPIPRQVLSVRLGPSRHRPVEVWNTHLTHRLTHVLGQLRTLRAGMAGCDVPVVAAGDFNVPHRILELLNARRHRRAGPTWPARRPMVQLDGFVAAGGCRLRESRAPAQPGADHVPVLGALRWC